MLLNVVVFSSSRFYFFPPTDLFETPKPWVDDEWKLSVSHAHPCTHSTNMKVTACVDSKMYRAHSLLGSNVQTQISTQHGMCRMGKVKGLPWKQLGMVPIPDFCDQGGIQGDRDT